MHQVGGEWVRRNDINALGRVQPGRNRIHDKCREPSCALLSGSRENHILIGDAAIRDECLATIDNVIVAVDVCRSPNVCDIRPGLRLCQRECGTQTAIGNAWQVLLFQGIGAHE